MKKSFVLCSVLIILSFLLVACVQNGGVADGSASTSQDGAVDTNGTLGQDSEQNGTAVPTKTNEVALPPIANDGSNKGTTELQTIHVKENELVKLKPTITDPDGDVVTWSFSVPLNEKGEWQTVYGDAGEYTVKLTATDGKLATTQDLTLVVDKVNVAPAISGVRDISVREGELVRFDPKVVDANGDSVTVSISEPLKSGSFATDHASAGEYTVTVTASDGELEAQKSFKLTVLDVNVKPDIQNVQDLVVAEGELVTIRPQVTDLDGDDVKVTISDPVGNDGEWKTDFTTHGEYFITVTAADGKDTVTKKVRIVVEDINKAPEIVDVSLQKR